MATGFEAVVSCEISVQVRHTITAYTQKDMGCTNGLNHAWCLSVPGRSALLASRAGVLCGVQVISFRVKASYTAKKEILTMPG